MKMRSLVLMVLMMAFVLALGTGCAKKTTGEETMAPVGGAVAPIPPAEGADIESADIKEMKAAEAQLTANKIYFDFDKFDLKDESKAILKSKAAILKKYSSWKMLIEGHCDSRGTEEYNLALGEKRARAAYEFLVVLGVPSSHLKIVSFGEERPAMAGNTESAWAKNRRAEFKIFK